MSEDEGAEDISDGQREGMLEQMLRAYAIDHYNKAVQSEGGVPAYFQRLISDVTEDYKNSRMVSESIYAFSVDRYIFYRRHLEMDAEDAIQNSYLDTFEYLITLKNDYPLVRPPMREDWRH